MSEVPRSGAGPLPRAIVVLVGTAGAVVIGAGLHGFADVAGPVFLALVLTVAVSPLRRPLVRHGVPSPVATVVTMVAVLAILLGLAGAMTLSLAKLATLLPTYRTEFDELVDDMQGALTGLGVGREQAATGLNGIDLGALIGVLQGWVGGLLAVFSNLVLIVMVSVFMCVDATRFPERMHRITAGRPQISAALHSFARQSNRYLIISTVFGLIVAALDTAVLIVLDIPLPLLSGLLAFITNYIPNVGFVIGVAPPALLALLDQGPGAMLMVIVAYSVINVVIQSFIQPKVVGDAVGLSVTITFLSLVVWTWIIGPLGSILAIPLTLFVKALLVDHDPSARWLAGLMTGGRAVDPDGRPDVRDQSIADPP